MPTPTIPAGNLFMNATTYTGTGASQNITNGPAGASFQPDFVWTKSRSSASTHLLFDSIRGVYNYLISATTDAEGSLNTTLTSFNSNGFSVGSNSTINNNSSTNVGWQWKAGGTAVTNTSGTISSQVSANTTSGFSVVTYTGNDTAGSTVGHGLGVAPSMMIIKERSQVRDWTVYHISTGNTGGTLLNTTGAVNNTRSGWFNNTTPSSTVFTLGGSSGSDWYQTNQTGQTYVAYCWAPIAGYSAFGSYTGNGSTDGPFIYTGFRPRFVMIKNAGSTGDWTITDTSRDTYNAAITSLYPNLSNSEGGGNIDILSNGFKIHNTTYQNSSGNTMIYAAFAENSFKYANAR